MPKHRITTTSFASVYPLYVAKAERKGRTPAEVDVVIRWLTGYSDADLRVVLAGKTDFETFFAQAPPPIPPARSSRAWSAAFGWRRSPSRPCGRYGISIS